MTITVPAQRLLACLLLAAALLAPAATARGQAATDCPDPAGVSVPAAEFAQAACLDDLTTLSNPRTDTTATGGAGTRSSGSLHSAHTRFPQRAVPGLQVEGWFPDSCSRYDIEHNSFMPACPGGFRHNGQFVIRVPDDWDGVHLVVAGTPGLRTQFASDIILSDWVVSKGWAYVAQDKGNTGLNFFRAGDDETAGSATRWVPGRAIEQWAASMRTAAEATAGLLEQTYGRRPSLTYAAGISNGGYQTRLALERHPDLFDGGLDWEGTLFTAEGPNLYTYIPPILRAFPGYLAGSQQDYDRLVHDGRLPPRSEPLWRDHYTTYYGAVASTYRPAVDPEYTDYVAAPTLVVPPQHPDARYDYASRPEFVKQRVAVLSNSGDTHGRPLLTLHGSLDALLPISTDSDVYARRVRAAGHGDRFRYYVVEGGTHVDTAADRDPDVFRPIFPCFRDGLDLLDAWVAEGSPPPPSGFVAFPEGQTPQERANSCRLPAPVDRVAGSDRVGTAVRASRQGFGIVGSVVVATAADFSDALAATPLAARLDGPVLLVDDAVTGALRDELQRLGALEAVVVGGSAAVSDTVAAELRALGLAVRRVAGPDRHATAAAVARELGGQHDEAFVANGRSYPDALAAAGLAARAGSPVLLVERDEIPASTDAAITELGVGRTVVAGGTAAVAASVEQRLPSPTRVAGVDRYATAVALAELGLARGHSLDTVYVATGRSFPDALAAGAVAAHGGQGTVPAGVLLLVDGSGDGSGPAEQFLQAHRDRVGQVLLFGGADAIGDPVADRLARALT